MKYLLSLILSLTFLTGFGQLVIKSSNGNSYTCDNERVVLRIENSNLYTNIVWTKITYTIGSPLIETLPHSLDSVVIDHEPAYLYGYQVNAKDAGGYTVTGTATMLIRASTIEELNIGLVTAGDYESICSATIAQIKYPGYVSSNHVFEWSKKNVLTDKWEILPLEINYSLDVYQSGEYKLKVDLDKLDVSTCHVYDELELKVLNPTVGIGDPNKNLCEGKSLVLKPITVPVNAEPLIYNWNSGFSTAPQITVYTDGFYNLETSYVTTQAVTCSASSLYEVVEVANPDLQDIPELTATTLPFSIDGGDFIASPSNFDYLWNTTGNVFISNNKVASHGQEGEYYLTVKDKVTKCTTTKTGQLIYIPGVEKEAIKLFVPNVLSPNETDENNQTLRVYGEDISTKEFIFEVYNRWGEIVYSTTSRNDARNIGWNGNRHNTGELLESGSYTYKVKGVYVTGETFNKIGYATLVK